MNFTNEEIGNIYFALGSLKVCCYLSDLTERETCTFVAIDSIKTIMSDAAAREKIEEIERLNREVIYQNHTKPM